MGMKKLLLFLTTFCMVCSAGNVFASPIAAGLETQLNKQLPAPLSPRQQQIVGALTQATSAKPREISWKMFEQESTQLHTQWQNQREQSQAFNKALYQQDPALYKRLLNPTTAAGWQQIEYAPELLNATHIFIGERHDTTLIPAQVENILAAVRQINPLARILLAVEFIRPEHPGQAPILFADGDASRFSQPYTNLVSKAQSLNMDLLALDNMSNYPGKPVCRMGNVAVTYDLQSPLVQRIIKQYGPQWDQTAAPWKKKRQQVAQQVDQLQKTLPLLEKNPTQLAQTAKKLGKTPKQFLETSREALKQARQQITNMDKQIKTFREESIYYYVTDQLARSDWGVNQRNAQWAQYIQAVQPFYDIVIVYAGSGHLSETAFQPLTKHLQTNAQKAVLFTFQTNEHLPADLEQAYRQSAQILRQENLTLKKESSLPEDVAQAVTRHPDLLQLDTSRSFYIKKIHHPWKSPWITPQEETLLEAFQTQYPQGFAALKPSDDIPEFITLDIFLSKDAPAATSTQSSPRQ